MDPRSGRWEHGSDLQWHRFDPRANDAEHPWGRNHVLYGSGRDALRGLLRFGKETHGWRRVWLPSYFCQRVVASLDWANVELAAYDDDPRVPSPDLTGAAVAHGEAVLLMNHFGLRRRPSERALDVDGAHVIEDHSHDPWSEWARSSTAHYCVASLRKTLPVPDGGVLWSPVGAPLPHAPPVSIERSIASANNLSASLLKHLYLEGHAVDKEMFRRMYRAGEDAIAAGAPSGATELTAALLDVLPVNRWRAMRRANYDRLRGEIASTGKLEVLLPQVEGACPLKLMVLLPDAETRDSVRRKLIEERVYTAILWPLDGARLKVSPRQLDLSRRVLGFSCEARYSAASMDRVAQLVLAVVGDCR